MPDPDDIELVRRAILSRTTGDCEWSGSAARRIRSDPSLSDWTLESIKAVKRSEYPQEYWYRVIVPVEQFKHGFLLEIILIDEDPEAPAVQIVSVHEQRN